MSIDCALWVHNVQLISHKCTIPLHERKEKKRCNDKNLGIRFHSEGSSTVFLRIEGHICCAGEEGPLFLQVRENKKLPRDRERRVVMT